MSTPDRGSPTSLPAMRPKPAESESQRMTRKAPLTLVSGLFAAVLAAGCNGNKTAPVEVMISLDKTATALRSAKVTVDYHQSGGTPLISDGVPACISIVPNVDCAFEDDGAGTLTITAKAQTSFSAPVDLAVCRMVPDSAAGWVTAAGRRASSDWKIRSTHTTASSPLRRTIPRAAPPGGDAMATIVSSRT